VADEKRLAEIESLARHTPLSADPFTRNLAKQLEHLLAELRASQAECERLRERGAEWRKERDEAIQANCAARAQLAEARHHANHCTDCCGLIFDLVKP
jgi:hypothetical protein